MPKYLSPGVYVEEVSSGSKPIEGVGTAVAAFVGFTEKGPIGEPTLVTNWTQFTAAFGDFVPNAYLPHAVYGYFLNGGGTAYIVRVGATEADADGGRAGRTDPVRLALPAADADGAPALVLRARDDRAEGTVTVEAVDASEPGDGAFKLVVRRDGTEVEAFDNVTVRRGPTNVATVVKHRSKVITIEEVNAPPQVGSSVALAPGLERSVQRLSAEDYVGDSEQRTGFAGLEAVDDVTMLCVPDVMSAHERGLLDDDGLLGVQQAMVAHCELMGDRVAILDPPPSRSAQQIKRWRMETAGYDSKYAALYWPWLRVMDPITGKPAHVPPSGHIAGIWARNDDTRGVHKAPANEVVRGAIAMELAITKGEQDQLNPVGVNCIRAFPGQGIRVWGARTLSSDPEWRYLNVRRLFNYVEKSILQGTNWVVFEPNDEKLWDSVKRTITMFLRGVWRDGALFGSTPEDSFFVKCDAENNPPDSVDSGRLVVDIGIAPVKPAEFVVFRISQYAEGAGLSE